MERTGLVKVVIISLYCIIRRRVLLGYSARMFGASQTAAEAASEARISF
jgi:ABC-type uncharacterized transport system permease subunit